MVDAKAAAGPTALDAASAPLRSKQSNYPEPFFSRMAKREKSRLATCSG